MERRDVLGRGQGVWYEPLSGTSQEAANTCRTARVPAQDVLPNQSQANALVRSSFSFLRSVTDGRNKRVPT